MSQPDKPAEQRQALLGMNKDSLAAVLREIGEPEYRAGQILDWIYRKRAGEFSEMTNISSDLRQTLAARFLLNRCETVLDSHSTDTTDKFLLRLHDGRYIETVLIPASPALYGDPSDRRTLCVSSQVGCAYGCRFCASGLQGWTRHLAPDEMVSQVLAAEKRSGERVNNIVFMGMGEPLANYSNWMAAVRILNAPWGMGIGSRRMTVSTSGLAPQIRRLAAEPIQLRLAVSLHGATDEVRERIMPINRKHNLAELLDACEEYQQFRRDRLTFEYILIADVNDSLDQASKLGAIARRLGALVNLIPYNIVEGLEWQRPSKGRLEAFQSTLHKLGVNATLRREKGTDINAACGQLRLRTELAESAPPS
jgi:23S rRNA (adenine2503-C2)-methyltransferase